MLQDSTGPNWPKVLPWASFLKGNVFLKKKIIIIIVIKGLLDDKPAYFLILEMLSWDILWNQVYCFLMI